LPASREIPQQSILRFIMAFLKVRWMISLLTDSTIEAQPPCEQQ